MPAIKSHGHGQESILQSRILILLVLYSPRACRRPTRSEVEFDGARQLVLSCGAGGDSGYLPASHHCSHSKTTCTRQVVDPHGR